MNLTLERASALSAFGRAVSIVERRNIIPILSNVALEANGGVLTVRATDLEMEVVEAIPAAIDAGGDTSVQADKLHDIVRNADAGSQVSIRVVEGDPRVKVRSGRSNFSMPSLPTANWPKFPVDGLDEGFDMPAAMLADMLTRVVWSIDPTDKTTVKGIVFLGTQDVEGRGRELHAVGAAFAGVALRRIPAPDGADIKVMLPPKVVSHLTKWLGDAEGDAHVSTSPNLIQVRHGGSTFTSKLFDAQGYFNYLGNIHEGHAQSARVAQDELATAVRRVMVMGDGRTGTLHITFSEGQAAIRAIGDASGEGIEEIGAEYDGPEAKIMIKASHLMSLLGAMTGDIAEFGFAAESDPNDYKTGLLVVRAPCDDGFICNAMQMRA